MDILTNGKDQDDLRHCFSHVLEQRFATQLIMFALIYLLDFFKEGLCMNNDMFTWTSEYAKSMNDTFSVSFFAIK